MKLILLVCYFVTYVQALSWHVTLPSGLDICKHPAQEGDQILANTTLQKKPNNGSVLASHLLFAHLGTPGDETLTQIIKGKCQGCKIQAVISSSKEYNEIRNTLHTLIPSNSYHKIGNFTDLLLSIDLLKVTKLDDIPIPPIGMFQEMDLNSDSEITLEEWMEFGKLKLEVVKNHPDPNIAYHFQEMEQNLEDKVAYYFKQRNFDSDEKISKREWLSFNSFHHEEL